MGIQLHNMSGAISASSLTVAGNTLAFGDVVTAGQVVPRRLFITSNAIPLAASGAIALTYFTADRTETISTLTMYTGGTAAAATPTLCKMGVYSVAANGDLTLIGSTANDTALFAGTNTTYARALTASYSQTVGQRYATAVIVVTGAATPTFHGWAGPATATMNTILTIDPTLSAVLTGQTDLPASIAVGSLATARLQYAMRLS